jgi:hypothetical protein
MLSLPIQAPPDYAEDGSHLRLPSTSVDQLQDLAVAAILRGMRAGGQKAPSQFCQLSRSIC